ncbi:hypothetical protein C5B42_04525 [Candidatus Cerribacteria bacterium 'Amazon FNV 2010 28 9']|uniref:TNase-like domain-containing protein n=1 Tax=Candidatus Cerribacteria bacterium 'Amazon FNV 2010 28 9' TaxID=2081795 RepID=A0A317JNF3_9BACT|nr:MAG: hypothetical protein C5B42_04525 [Candidatus Cerribacteria bacterium 'Amazon FNV 2010 28 9']
MNSKIPYHLVVLFILLIGILYLAGAKPQFEKMPNPVPRLLSLFTQVPQGYVKVVDDIDGDTIIVLINGKEETVRLLGVDTPETKDPRKPVQCFGHEASTFTREHVQGQAVRLVVDPSQGNEDVYHRLLRYVYLPNGVMLDELLIVNGYGFAFEKYPITDTPRMVKLEQQAKEQSRGLWGKCEVTITADRKSKSTNAIGS